MSDNQHRGSLGQEGPSQTALLDELDSLRELLDEDVHNAVGITSISEIRSVKEYMLLKQEAGKAGLELDVWLAQRADAAQKEVSEEENPSQEAPEEMIPLLDEVVEVGNLPFGTGERDNVPDTAAEQSSIESDAIYAAARAALENPHSTLEALEQMVAQLVEQKLQALKPELQKQIFDQLRNGLPVEWFK